jgi:transcriptional regulator with XRE-family HTH domain
LSLAAVNFIALHETLHTGEKVKRLRSFKGLKQEDLAQAIGKTRSMVSFLERTGNINKYTLQEVAVALDVPVSIFEADDMLSHLQMHRHVAEDLVRRYNKDAEEDIILMLHDEIKYLRATIAKQWDLIFELSKQR